MVWTTCSYSVPTTVGHWAHRIEDVSVRQAGMSMSDDILYGEADIAYGEADILSPVGDISSARDEVLPAEHDVSSNKDDAASFKDDIISMEEDISSPGGDTSGSTMTPCLDLTWLRNGFLY